MRRMESVAALVVVRHRKTTRSEGEQVKVTHGLLVRL